MTLLTKEELSEHLKERWPSLTPQRIAYLWRHRKIPGHKLGHRTLLFNLQKVIYAIERTEVEAWV